MLAGRGPRRSEKVKGMKGKKKEDGEILKIESNEKKYLAQTPPSGSSEPQGIRASRGCREELKTRKRLERKNSLTLIRRGGRRKK